MREEILIKHLKNLSLENSKIKDVFIMGVDGLLIAVREQNDENQDLAARMSGVIDLAKRIENKLPEALSVITTNNKIIAIPLSENFLIIIIGTKDMDSFSTLRQVGRSKNNILSLIEKTEFGDLFSYRPVEINGLDI
ncbi:MAG: roadblock/LC7 domain-containing protein [Candidatus Methanofastidiosum sp.]|jgi:predicted regulator of Ras-like GTPase activity (Roadblock/LC7/MglB family)|nr:roadblock/LC7 domain-containing protein [Methanofastidiosum sp.]